MNFILKGKTKDTTKWTLRHVSCFNTLRHMPAWEDYTDDDALRVGTFVEEPKEPVQYPTVMDCINWDLRVLRKAQRVIPLLRHVKLEKAFLSAEKHPNLSPSFRDRVLHIVTVPTTGLPADEALTAIFMARDIINGVVRHKYASVFGGERLGIYCHNREPLMEGYNPNKFWGNNKYFTAVLYFLLAFQPYRYRNLFEGGAYLIRPALNLDPSDGLYWSNRRTSLYSVLRFAKEDGYNFVQPSLQDQRGYIRDSVFHELDNDNPIKQAVTARIFRRGLPTREAVINNTYLYSPRYRKPGRLAISNLLTEGEQREHFLIGNRYAIENYISDFGTYDWGMIPPLILAVIDHLVDILTNDSI